MSSLQRGENWVRSASRNSRARASALDPTTQSKLPHCYFQFRPYEINADNQGFTVREVVPRISGRMSIPYQTDRVHGIADQFSVNFWTLLPIRSRILRFYLLLKSCFPVCFTSKSISKSVASFSGN